MQLDSILQHEERFSGKGGFEASETGGRSKTLIYDNCSVDKLIDLNDRRSAIAHQLECGSSLTIGSSAGCLGSAVNDPTQELKEQVVK